MLITLNYELLLWDQPEYLTIIRLTQSFFMVLMGKLWKKVIFSQFAFPRRNTIAERKGNGKHALFSERVYTTKSYTNYIHICTFALYRENITYVCNNK